MEKELGYSTGKGPEVLRRQWVVEYV